MVIQVTAENSFILRFNRDAYNAKVEEGPEITEGVEEAFEIVDHFYLLTAKPTIESSVKTVKNRRLLPPTGYVVGSGSNTPSSTRKPFFIFSL